MTKIVRIVIAAFAGVALLTASRDTHAQARGAGKDPALIQKKSAFPLVPDTPMAVTLPPLGTRNQQTGASLILRAVSEGAELNAPRMMALGVLGSQMLDGQQHLVLGYQSLFTSIGRGCRLDASARSEIRFAGAINNADGTVDVPLPANSLIARREAMMYALAANLRSRLADKGNASTSFGGRKSKKNDVLARDLERAAALVAELDAAGLHDANLVDLAGVVAASLERDGVKSAKPPKGAQATAVYREALDIATKIARPGKDNTEILTILAQSMEAKGLEGCTDRLLAPRDAASHKKIVDAITKELVPPKPVTPKKKR